MNKWIPTLIALMAVSGLRAQEAPQLPKLVVSIVVDQLRGDYLQYFTPTFGERGFKRLMNEGVVYHQVEFGFPNIGKSPSIATIYTGAYPYYNGITSDQYYNFETKKKISPIHDETYLGNYTSDRFSPLALLSSTFGDELKVASEGKADVYAIAPDAEQAILSAGRNANAAYWLDNYNGKWATTTYYKDVAWYVDQHNTNQSATSYPEQTWTPALSSYSGFPYTKNTQTFKHSISRSDQDKYLKFKQTPFINTEITNLAATFFKYADFGKRSSPDLLTITYYAGDYSYKTLPEPYSLEIQDLYYRLDKEIERLLDLIDEKVGKRNVLVVLSSTGYYNSEVNTSNNLSTYGEFYPNRCTALLNMYLMAIYGQGNWVNGYYNNQIYLNKKLIENKEIKWDDILKKAAEFVAQFSGVQDVTTADQWLFDDMGRSVEFRRGMNKKISGDIFIELQPGWIAIDENQNPKTVSVVNQAVLSPLFFFGGNIKNQHVFRKVKATQIAPTVTHVLRIRPPNGCKDAPLDEFLK